MDTGELVAGSYRLRVLHPPGYPLFQWLQFIATHLIAISTIFWRAAFMNSLWAAGLIAFLVRLNPSPANALALALPLAFSQIFYKYSVLPDVFVLHALICTVFAGIYLYWESNSRKFLVMSLLFGLGAANHQSIIFLLPLLLHEMLKQKSPKAAALALAMGAGSTLLLYSTILFLDHGALDSWGDVKGLKDLFWHVSRQDYGTFQLVQTSQHADTLSHLKYFAQACLADLSLVLVLCFFPQKKNLQRYFVLLGSILLYVVVFFPLANTDSQEVFQRFVLMPQVLLTLLAGYNLGARTLSRSATFLLGLGGGVLIAHNLLNYAPINNLSHNFAIEDYARNLLSCVEGGKPSVLVLNLDTQIGAMKYLLATEENSKPVVIAPLGNIFDEAHAQKIQALYPNFFYDSHWKTGGHPASIADHMVEPNVKNFDFYFTRSFSSEKFKTTYLPLGRKISDGKGSFIGPEQKLTFRTPWSDSNPSLQSEELKYLFAEYSFYYLKKGLMNPSHEEAIADFQRALQIVPYCYPAAENICRLKNENCNDLLGTLDADRVYF